MGVDKPGVFVAGDVRHGSLKRVASAVGDGAMAVQMIHQYLADPAMAGGLPEGGFPPEKRTILASEPEHMQ